MSKRKVILAVGLMLLATALLVPGVSAQGPPPMGSWITTTTVTAFPPFKSLFTFGLYGTLMSSQAYLLPAGPGGGKLVYSSAHGVWDRAPNGDIAITFVTLIHDDNGNFLGTSKVRGTLRLSPGGDTLTGTAKAENRDPAGNLLFSFDATFAGTRIVLEPL